MPSTPNRKPAPGPVALGDLSAARFTVPDSVVHREFPTETVLLNLETGRYHGLNTVAGKMFAGLVEGQTVAEVAGALAIEHEMPVEEIESDVGALCVDLSERGLIVPDVGVRH